LKIIPRHRIEIEWPSLLEALFLSKRENVDTFKAKLVDFFGGKIIFLQSGRGAFYSLLLAMPQKTVLIPAYTCKVIPEAALLAGKEIVYIDIDLHTLNMDVKDLERKIRPQSVIVATHQFGIPCDMEAMAQQAKENECVIIEDCAGAFGSKIKGKRTGTFGLASIFSFEFTKVVSAGRGGFILFNDDPLYDQVRSVVEEELEKPSSRFMANMVLSLLLHKFLTKPLIYRIFINYFSRRFGLSKDRGEIVPEKDELYRYRLSPVEATLGLRNFERVEPIIQRRWEIALRYVKGLSGVEGLALPVFPRDSFCSLMRFPVRVTGQEKKEFFFKCLGRGLDLGFSFNYSCSDRCANSVVAAQQVVNLPLNSHLRDEEVDRVITIVKEVLE
jgi:perosamine synthetase